MGKLMDCGDVGKLKDEQSRMCNEREAIVKSDSMCLLQSLRLSWHAYCCIDDLVYCFLLDGLREEIIEF